MRTSKVSENNVSAQFSWKVYGLDDSFFIVLMVVYIRMWTELCNQTLSQ